MTSEPTQTTTTMAGVPGDVPSGRGRDIGWTPRRRPGVTGDRSPSRRHGDPLGVHGVPAVGSLPQVARHAALGGRTPLLTRRGVKRGKSKVRMLARDARRVRGPPWPVTWVRHTAWTRAEGGKSMRERDGSHWCDKCGSRARRGVLRVSVSPATLETRHIPRGGDDLTYCSERCLRDTLLGLRDPEDATAILGREVSRLERQVRQKSSDVQSAVEDARV